MSNENPTSIPIRTEHSNTAAYLEDYANSVNVNVSLWDFKLTFGRISQAMPDVLLVQNFAGVYLSPQQAKALLMF